MVESALDVVGDGDGVVEVVGVEETADAVDEAAVPMGTSFCRYCRGWSASSILMADDKKAKRRSRTYTELAERNMVM